MLVYEAFSVKCHDYKYQMLFEVTKYDYNMFFVVKFSVTLLRKSITGCDVECTDLKPNCCGVLC
jgi:hypothetical protein